MDSMWTNFPVGLRVLVVDNDDSTLKRTKDTLESFKYKVYAAGSAQEVDEMLAKPGFTFDVALLEATLKGDGDSDAAFNLLGRLSPHRPVLMCSKEEDMELVKRAIMGGAEEFMQKPIAPGKLELIWQHLVRQKRKQAAAAAKAPRAVVSAPAPIKVASKPTGSVTSSDEGGKTPRSVLLINHMAAASRRDSRDSTGSVWSEASTKRGSCMDGSKTPRSVLARKESHGSMLSESSDGSAGNNKRARDEAGSPECESVLKEELDMAGGSGAKAAALAGTQDGEGKGSFKARKKLKVDWTPELHKKFVSAVEQLGVDKAIPSRILELMGEMGVGLTRHHIASHLQKYRCNKRHEQLREAGASAPPGGWKAPYMPGARPAAGPFPGAGGAGPMATPMGGLHVWGQPAPPSMQSSASPPIMGVPVCVPRQVPGQGQYLPVREGTLAPTYMDPSVPIAAAAAHAAATLPCFPSPPEEIVRMALREGASDPSAMVLGLKAPCGEALLKECGHLVMAT